MTDFTKITEDVRRNRNYMVTMLEHFEKIETSMCAKDFSWQAVDPMIETKGLVLDAIAWLNYGVRASVVPFGKTYLAKLNDLRAELYAKLDEAENIAVGHECECRVCGRYNPPQQVVDLPGKGDDSLNILNGNIITMFRWITKGIEVSRFNRDLDSWSPSGWYYNREAKNILADLLSSGGVKIKSNIVDQGALVRTA